MVNRVDLTTFRIIIIKLYNFMYIILKRSKTLEILLTITYFIKVY